MSCDEDADAKLTHENNATLVLHGPENVTEPIDPRRDPLVGRETVDQGHTKPLDDRAHHLDDHLYRNVLENKQGVFHGNPQDELKDGPFYIEFEKGDGRDPANFSPARKWAITLTACLFAILVTSAGAAYALGFDSMTRDLNCTEFQATIGISVYALGFGLPPLVTASLSEEFGRQPIYICSGVGFLLFTLMIALAKNIQTVIVGRFIVGMFGSTGSTLVGGTIADIFMPNERGVPIALFSTSSIGGIGVGCLAAGWIEQNHRLQWRWIQWIYVIFTGLFVVCVPLFMRETRASVLLVRLAKKMRKETGDRRIRARVEDERDNLSTLLYISCTRAPYLMITEPIVASFTLWIGFAWGILYVLIESVGPVFRALHNFNAGQTGTVFLTMTIGSLLGMVSNVYQGKLYNKYVGTRGPEARLFAAMAATVLFPAGMFIYAWSTYTKVYWISLAIGMVLIMWAIFIIFFTVFTYLADWYEDSSSPLPEIFLLIHYTPISYGPFASSAMAGQSLFRNLMGMAFPLFTQQMFARLTYHWANTLFGFVALAIAPLPFVSV
ncbi:hypothetical protein AcV5_002713 [Taiwanofungus camphoratus]|nr:hypothetical protein AcV5_002713 [Antrodia cinnamomea]